MIPDRMPREFVETFRRVLIQRNREIHRGEIANMSDTSDKPTP